PHENARRYANQRRLKSERILVAGPDSSQAAAPQPLADAQGARHVVRFIRARRKSRFDQVVCVASRERQNQRQRGGESPPVHRGNFRDGLNSNNWFRLPYPLYVGLGPQVVLRGAVYEVFSLA